MSRRIYIFGKIFSTLHRRQPTISCQLPIADSFGLLIVAANYLHCTVILTHCCYCYWCFCCCGFLIISYGGQENRLSRKGQQHAPSRPESPLSAQSVSPAWFNKSPHHYPGQYPAKGYFNYLFHKTAIQSVDGNCENVSKHGKIPI